MHPNGPGTKGNVVLVAPVEGHKGVHRVIGGAGGKLNGLRLQGVKDKGSYEAEAKERIRKAAEEKVNAYFNSSNDGLLVLDPDWGWEHANGRALELFGCASMEELLAELPLADVVKDGLLDGTGPIGELLQAIDAYERVDLPLLDTLRPGELARFIRVYREAAVSAQQLRSQLLSVAS
jgi:PAS domain-containing protein